VKHPNAEKLSKRMNMLQQADQYLLRSINYKAVIIGSALIVLLCLSSCSLFINSSKDTPPLSISIEFPKSQSGRFIQCPEKEEHFHITLLNNSDQAKLVFKDTYSVGYEALSFEITDQYGNVTVVKRAATSWLSNIPDYYVVKPHDRVTMDIFYKRYEWQQFPFSNNGKVNIRALFQQNLRELYGYWKKDEQYLWVGKIISESHEIVLYNKEGSIIFENDQILSTINKKAH
jgi:hypothetical protein